MAEQNACAENLGANILNDCNDDYGKGVEKIVYIIKKRTSTVRHRRLRET